MFLAPSWLSTKIMDRLHDVMSRLPRKHRRPYKRSPRSSRFYYVKSTQFKPYRIGYKDRTYGRQARFWLLLWLAFMTINNPPKATPCPANVPPDPPPADPDPAFAEENNTLLALATTNSSNVRPATYDTDSVPIKIDNCCSACITNNWSEFAEPPKPISAFISGIGGPVQCTHKGTIRWTFEDDTGRPHTFLIPNSYYA